ncbi:MAG: hypothetical protein HY902_03200 [Deltaproteobacteria bacterium]|nr:hypothetical protein [Deltaproteobacteria bacterium]
MADPNWQPERQQLPPIDNPVGATATQLPLPATPAAAPEAASELLQTLKLRPVDDLSVQLELPEPCTAVASGAGQDETWTFERSIAGSACGLRVTIRRRPLHDLAELVAAAGELSVGQLEDKGKDVSGLVWARKKPVGPVQDLWVGLPAGAVGRIAVCSAPPAYAELARRVCFSLRPIEVP